jgi:hypothetical protein
MACTEDPERSLSAKIAWEIIVIVAIFADRCIEVLVESVFGKTFGLLLFWADRAEVLWHRTN